MNYREFYQDLISRLLEGSISRDEAAKDVTSNVSVDFDYGCDHLAVLFGNFEWALRHSNEPGFYAGEKQLKYYLE